MTGWRTTKDVMDLRDEIVAKLDAAPKDVRRYAWYWISFHMNIEYELEERGVDSPLDDEALAWLRSVPEKYERHKKIKEQLVKHLEKRLANAKRELSRLTETPGTTE